MRSAFDLNIFAYDFGLLEMLFHLLNKLFALIVVELIELRRRAGRGCLSYLKICFVFFLFLLVKSNHVFYVFLLLFFFCIYADTDVVVQ